MVADTKDTGWKRFLDRIRKLWEVPPQHVPIPTRMVEPAQSASIPSDDAPKVSQR